MPTIGVLYEYENKKDHTPDRNLLWLQRCCGDEGTMENNCVEVWRIVWLEGKRRAILIQSAAAQVIMSWRYVQIRGQLAKREPSRSRQLIVLVCLNCEWSIAGEKEKSWWLARSCTRTLFLSVKSAEISIVFFFQNDRCLMAETSVMMLGRMSESTLTQPLKSHYLYFLSVAGSLSSQNEELLVNRVSATIPHT